VNLFGHGSSSESTASLRHEFAIGPLRDHFLFKDKARQYYCIRCKWTFLVAGNKVAVLDEHGSPLTDDESTNRFGTFALGPCPVLEALTSEAFEETTSSQVARLGREFCEPRPLVPGNVTSSNRTFGPLRRILTRLQGDLKRFAGST